MSTFEYTAEVTADVVARYIAAVAAGASYEDRTKLVQEIASELSAVAETSVSEASVRSKLVAEKVYVPKEKVKAEGTGASKTEYVKALEAIVGVKLPSFEKATKRDVAAVVDYIKLASAQRDAEMGVREPE